ncbi:MAG: NAD-dependent epimerase/dehydratase family protein [Erysipelotrichaceae bacterium]|nr:NAD-dependent epimerase/dehydratase family protein [Erysipelotrichaceae bacterium]
MKILITGGTVFVSRYITRYFKEKHDVYVLNRGTRKQENGVTHIKADRHILKNELRDYHFDTIIDVCAYNKQDIDDLLNAVDNVNDYIFISSSAVYPKTNQQPFTEEQITGYNTIWKDYGTNKIAAEETLLQKIPNAYIIRPPYLYGPIQNVYREPFIFECALKNRKFYIPKDGSMKLQFFHVEDLCKIIEIILEKHPLHHIYNVGNEELVDINTFVELCYEIAGKKLGTVHVYNHNNQRDYFSFYDYEYVLDISKQKELLPQTKNLKQGLQESFEWYIHHQDDVVRKNYIDFIDKNLT